MRPAEGNDEFMSSAGEQGRTRGDQGIDAWAKHGLEEYDEREAMDRAERGLNASELNDFPAEAGPEADMEVGDDETQHDDAEHYGSGAGSPVPSNRQAGSAKTIES